VRSNYSKEKEMNLQRDSDPIAQTLSYPCGIQQERNDEYLAEQDVHPVLTLDERGMILDCNKLFEMLFGIEWHNLIWHHISRLFPQLTAQDFALAGEVYPIREYLIRCGQLHQAQDRHGVPFSCNLIFVRAAHEGKCCLRLTVIPSGGTKLYSPAI
jgi:hypothetical protein